MKVTGRLESEFVLRFQQFTSPVMAKGVEDTAFYCYNRLTAMCEVGGDPTHDGLSVPDFHAYQQRIQSTNPSTMVTLSTHDTKRSDDVRARLAVLSEIPQEFAAFLQSAAKVNASFRQDNYPDPNTEYFLYQTLIGAWPIDADRAKAYMLKAMREAKQQTSWVQNNQLYEEALNAFIESVLTHQPFLDLLEKIVTRVLLPGRVNSLAQTLLKHTAPGVPDLYQGGELWDLSLVDPDNRRPVDYRLRRDLLKLALKATPQTLAPRLPDPSDEGLPKLFLITIALHLRKEHPDFFGPEALYTPIEAQGPASGNVIAYSRGTNLITIAPRLSVDLDWKDTTITLPPGLWHNALTGAQDLTGALPLTSLLTDFPVALLTLQPSSPDVPKETA
jgi:(1->4)-alpha-D-glucan 1-alpha-D-glucosylmutase